MSNDVAEVVRRLKCLTPYTCNQINAWIGEELFSVIEVNNGNRESNATPFVLISVDTRDKIVRLIEDLERSLREEERAL